MSVKSKGQLGKKQCAMDQYNYRMQSSTGL